MHRPHKSPHTDTPSPVHGSHSITKVAQASTTCTSSPAPLLPVSAAMAMPAAALTATSPRHLAASARQCIVRWAPHRHRHTTSVPTRRPPEFTDMATPTHGPLIHPAFWWPSQRTAPSIWAPHTMPATWDVNISHMGDTVPSNHQEPLSRANTDGHLYRWSPLTPTCVLLRCTTINRA